MSDIDQPNLLDPYEEVLKNTTCKQSYSEAKKCYDQIGDWGMCKYERDSYYLCMFKEIPKDEEEHEHPGSLEELD